MKRICNIAAALLMVGCRSALADPTNVPAVGNRTVMADSNGVVVIPTNFFSANSNAFSAGLGLPTLITDVASNSATVSGLPTSYTPRLTFNAATVAQWAAVNTLSGRTSVPVQKPRSR